jgi:scyllo-inositol 2-dehydrogenase (NADP+)
MIQRLSKRSMKGEISLLKLGIAGYGRTVEFTHLPLIKKMKDILELTAIYDVTKERLELATRKGISGFNELAQFLNSDTDVILIATPPKFHYEIAMEALKKGKHLIIEKPISLDAKEAVDIMELAKKMNKIVTVFQNRRFDSNYLFVKSVIQSNELGSIRFVERSHHMNGSASDYGVKSFNPEWRNLERFGGGILLDWGVHLVDQVMNLNLGEITDIRSKVTQLNESQGNVEDFVHSIITLDNGTVIIVDINALSSATKPSWIIGGEHATLIVHDVAATMIKKGEEPQNFEIPLGSRFAGQPIYTTFIDEIEGKGKSVVTLDEAIQTMEVLDAIRK